MEPKVLSYELFYGLIGPTLLLEWPKYHFIEDGPKLNFEFLGWEMGFLVYTK